MAYDWCATCGNITQYCRCQKALATPVCDEITRAYMHMFIDQLEAMRVQSRREIVYGTWSNEYAQPDAKIGDCWKHDLVTEGGPPEAGQNSADRSGPILT